MLMATLLCADPPTLLPQPQTLDSCKSLSSLKQLHAQILKSPNPSDPSLFARLVSSYGRLGDLNAAAMVFEQSPQDPDAFLFNSLIQSHVSNSSFLRPLEVYAQMLSCGAVPNKYTFPHLFKACAASSQASCGSQLHAQVIKLGFWGNQFVGAALADMYMKNGEVGEARKVFDGMVDRDVVAWNTMLTGYSQNGRPEEALEVYDRMRQVGVAVDYVAVASVLAACSQLRQINLGSWLHSWVLKTGFAADVVVATALVDMYANCGELRLAKQVFKEMSSKDLIAWNCLICWCAETGLTVDAFELFVEMQRCGLKPNGSSLAGVLPAVAQFGSLKLGKSCHGFIVRNVLDADEFVMTALMDVYAKSGDLSVARKLFDTMSTRSVVSWSAMISGYGAHGCGAEAVSLFDKMLAHKIQPNYITYIGVLSACVHAGYVEKGRLYFQQMVRDHRINARLQHYTCMVDLLGRAGLLDEAMDLIKEMPFEASPDIWGALLGACRIHGNVELAKYAADRLFELNPSDPGFYVLLSNIYAAADMWSEVRRVRGVMRDLGLRKPAGWSSIEIGSYVHSFISGDKSHSDSDEIYKKLDELTGTTKRAGYVPKTEVVLHDVEDDVKESVLSSHSEKLAMSYGLLRLTPCVPIRIMKNLRTCEDCHAFAKFVSKVTCREIILRDAVRFHHIKDGVCTCSDYW
ncbi:hypothetical protein Taro_032962 [Colocasia esculenta]|uniref:DYW domain-containing protein n=1 Tax=Colocasia esculenta TaxID=4460 RepID=A0A843W0E8_COLES|nr:hypothetical protein [Colocasia esculenta]